MEFQKLLDAVDGYVRIKRDAESTSGGPCFDWDCGLASDMEGQSVSLRRAEREKAKKSMEEALNNYIDKRIRRILAENQEK